MASGGQLMRMHYAAVHTLDTWLKTNAAGKCSVRACVRAEVNFPLGRAKPIADIC